MIWKMVLKPRPNGSRAARQSLRRLPRLEPLEGRALMTSNFGQPLAVTGRDLQVDATTVDRTGDIFVVGTFYGSVAFGAGPNDIVTSDSNIDMFVAKYDPSHTLDWVKSFATGAGGTPSTDPNTVLLTFPDHPTSIAVDAVGNAYLTGYFADQGALFNQPAGSPTLSTQNFAGFLIKLDPDGNVGAGMAKSFGSDGTAQAFAVALDPTGTQVYVGGTFQGTVAFDPNSSDGTRTGGAISTGDSSSFVLKLNASDLSFAWVRGVPSGDDGVIANLGVDSLGDVFAAGGTTDRRQLVTKYNAAGDTLATATFAAGGDPYYAYPLLVTDLAGNVDVAGVFGGTNINFNPGSGAPVDLSSAGNGTTDVYLAQFDSTLNLKWAVRFGGSGKYLTSNVSALAIDPTTGVLALGGYINGNASIGTNGATDQPVLFTQDGTAEGQANGYVIQVDGTGKYVAGRTIGGATTSFNPADHLVDGLAVLPSGDLAVIGNYDVPVTLDDYVLQSTYPTNFYLANLIANGTRTGTSTTILPPLAGPVLTPTPTPIVIPSPTPTVPPTTTPVATPTPTVTPTPTTVATPTSTPTPTLTPTPTVFVGPIAANPTAALDPVVAATTVTRNRRGITTINMAFTGNPIPSFHAAHFVVEAQSRFNAQRFNQHVRVKSLTYNPATHVVSLHLATPHQGALQLTATARLTRTTVGGAKRVAYRTIVR